MDDYGRIRRAHRDGMSIRGMARQFHHSRRKLREILRGGGEPPTYGRREGQLFPKLGAVRDQLREILEADESAPPKQRHTAMRLFERLRDEHQYQGGYDAIRRFMKRHRAKQRETFIPLDHASGRRMEADFGKIYVDFPEGRRQVSVLILVWSCSNAPFAIALPTERTEAILEGMQQAFEFFGGVPREVWWDNPKTVAEQLLVGRDRKLNPRYAAFASHYAFEPLCCMPASGNEKPVVENRVKTMQRRWGTPVPTAKNMDELNTSLRQCCVNDQSRPATAAGLNAMSGAPTSPQPTTVEAASADATPVEPTSVEPKIMETSAPLRFTIGDVLKFDLQQSAALPRHAFEACVRQPVMVDKYQMVRFDNVGYSVPRQVAFKAVTVKGFVHRVDVTHEDRVVATHVRSYAGGSEILDPRHYLTTLSRRPAALDHSNVYRDWLLPEAFADLRSRLEQRHGVRSGVRHFVRVLQLLGDHSVAQVTTAIEQLRGSSGADVDHIIRRVESSSSRSHDSPPTDLHGLVRSDVTNVKVPSPGLSHFDSLLASASTAEVNSSHGDCTHDEDPNHDIDSTPHGEHAGNSQRYATAEIEPATTAIANDRSRVREAGAGSHLVESDVRTVPAQADRTRSDGPSVERTPSSHQASQSARGEGSGQLRFLGDPFTEQAEDLGTGTGGMDHEALECVPAGTAGDR